MSRDRHAKLELLHRKFGGRCVYCNTLTILPESGVNYKELIPNQATKDHIWSLNDLYELVELNELENIQETKNLCVLACAQCNQTRNQLESGRTIEVEYNKDHFRKIISIIPVSKMVNIRRRSNQNYNELWK